MINNAIEIKKQSITINIVWNIIALIIIYFIPTISHLLALPLYLFEPIRIITVLSLLFNRKLNAYILALSLPVFSFFVSGHPVLFKMMIISAELLLNVYLFYFFTRKTFNPVISVFLSILLSKIFYYIIQTVFISLSLLSIEETEHPILPQIILTAGLSLLAFIIYKRRNAIK